MLTEKNKQALIVGVVLGALLLFLIGYFYFISVKPALAAGVKARAKLTTDVEALEKQMKAMQELINDKEKLADMERVVATARKRLPNDEQAIEFLGILRDSLAKTGVSQNMISKEKTLKRSVYSEIPYKIKGSARYHEFGQFVNLIECNPERFMRVTDFKLSNNNKRPSIHPMDVGISTFMLPSVSAGPVKK